MRFKHHPFLLHDVTEFPFVVFKQKAALPGYANQWEQEMVVLIDNNEPFVVVYDSPRGEESHDDRKRRGIWLKHNKAALGRVCKALISIEPDAEQRALLKALSDGATKAFGITQVVVPSRNEALTLAKQLIGDTV